MPSHGTLAYMAAPNPSAEGAPPRNRPSLSLSKKLLLAFFLFGCAPTIFTWAYFLVVYRDLAALAQESLTGEAAAQITQAFHHDLQNALLLLGIVFLLMLGGIVFAERILLAPVANMRRWLDAQHAKNFEDPDPVPPNLDDELGELWKDMGTTVTQFHEIKGREHEIAEQKNEFLMVAAHQLRTPLAGIRWGLEALLKDSVGETRAAIERMLTAGSNMASLIDSFLGVSKLEEGKLGTAFADRDIRTLVEGVMQESAGAAKNHGIALTLDAPEGGEYHAWADEETLRLAVSNLIDNAVNYSPKGAQVTIRLAPGDHALAVSVEDTGIGMTSEEMKRLFVKFSRAPEAVKLHPDGSGLGLYIARNVALRHGSDITVTSTKGVGSRFSFALARTQADFKRERTSVEQFFSSF